MSGAGYSEGFDVTQPTYAQSEGMGGGDGRVFVGPETNGLNNTMRSAPILVLLGEQDGAIGLLYDAVSNLSDRLEPVLGPERPESENCLPQDAEDAESALASEIRRQTRSIRRLIDRISELQARIEL